MYRVIYDYGSEGWGWDEEEFETAEKALYAGIHSGRCCSFKVVKIVEFVEKQPKEGD